MICVTLVGGGRLDESPCIIHVHVDSAYMNYECNKVGTQ